MSRFRFPMLGAILVLALLPWALSQDTTLGEQIAQQGTPAGVTPCMACHGQAGSSFAGTPFPRLAGLDMEYIVKQLRDFQAGLRADAMMSPVAALLEVPEMEAVAAYFAEQAPPPLPTPDDAAQVALGMDIANRGLWSVYLPACASCHGPLGVGVGDTFPALAGQNAVYTVKQFENWRTGIRHNDVLSMMQSVVERMTDEQIAAVAAYYQSLGTDTLATEGAE